MATLSSFFFFQAEDGIRDFHVTGVQTCALPISWTLAPYLRDGTVVVNKSTVPVGSADWVRTLLEEALPRNAAPAFHVVSNPEFLREGSAIEDFLYPDRI